MNTRLGKKSRRASRHQQMRNAALAEPYKAEGWWPRDTVEKNISINNSHAGRGRQAI